MKVMLVNGSPHEHGCTDAALREVASALNADGIDTEIFWIAIRPSADASPAAAAPRQANASSAVRSTTLPKRQRTRTASCSARRVHYAAASGNMTAFMDRLFYSAPKEAFCRKPAAVITSARRAGTTAAYEQLLKYPGITEMPIVSSCYWNNVHGSRAEDIQQDEEGVRIMRVLGHNMAWLLRCIEAGKAAGVPEPRKEPLAKTNFIR